MSILQGTHREGRKKVPEDVFWEAYQDLEMENEILREQATVLWQVIDSFPQTA